MVEGDLHVFHGQGVGGLLGTLAIALADLGALMFVMGASGSSDGRGSEEALGRTCNRDAREGIGDTAMVKRTTRAIEGGMRPALGLGESRTRQAMVVRPFGRTHPSRNKAFQVPVNCGSKLVS